MRHKNLIILILLLLGSTSLFGFELDIKDEIPSYENLIVKLEPSLKEGTIKEARFDFYQKGVNDPLYSEFIYEDGDWIAKVPYTYLEGEELVYFAIMKNTDNEIFRYPKIGNKKTKLIKDETAPKLKLVSSDSFNLVKDKQELIVFEIIDESALSDFSITIDGEETTKAGAYDNYLSILVDPTNKEERVISIEMNDRYNNKSREEFVFKTNLEKQPFFLFEKDFDAFFELAYTLDMGNSQNTIDFMSVLDDLNHEVELSFGIEGETKLKGGPIKIEASAKLCDTIGVDDILDSYPNTLVADLQNILNLYNPIDFENEFDYSDEDPRRFENGNQFLIKLALFDPILSYKFGDQEITYQEETIKSFNIRGSSLELDLPFFDINIAKGLSNLGLFEVSWPQNYLGFKISFKAKDFWYFQTNLSLINSLQGNYDDLILSSATSPIESLYNLNGIFPEQNMTLGMGTGIKNEKFNLKTSFAFSLYNEDSSTVLDIDQLANDLKDNGGPDLTTYLGYLDKINSIIPVLNYFLPSNGLVAGVINKDLWGISYGLDLDISDWGIEAWARKTDANYKSIGSSIPTDELNIGVYVAQNIGEFDLKGGYTHEINNIDDILFNDIIPIVMPSLAPTNTISENDIADINQTAIFELNMPQNDLFGTLSLDYSYLLENNNVDSLISQTDDATIISDLENSSDNDITSTHTGEIRWSSSQFDIGKISTNFKAKYKNAFVKNIIVDGVEQNNSYIETSYDITGGIDFNNYSLSLEFNHEFSNEANSSSIYAYEIDFSIKDTLFDSLKISTGLDQEFKTSLEAYEIEASLNLEKQFGIFTSSAVLEASYFDSLLDNSEDSLSANLVIKGIIRK